jgi:DNA sulfur modification protein DndB
MTRTKKKEKAEPDKKTVASEAHAALSHKAQSTEAEWAFPAIRGIQAGGEYYAVMVRLKEVASFFAPVDNKVPPELRS